MGSPMRIPAPMPPGEEMTARAGEPLPEGATVADREAVIGALRTVHDPEIPVNIYDLGLIYDLGIHTDGSVRIEMSLTAPACPVAGEIPYWVANAVADVEGIGEVEVNLIWDPPWDMERMSGDAKLALGID
ncbi:MAG: SUF system Fe-S cluster assembly protein [Alphaproteobacteria bacterium]|nr:SUF system Fe-S cluster assembly protein [Alphaproteobacteria bacterium]HCP01482.1 SUF system Fe-S cluster assembly protein [Rhodospirillaceae bacterium]